jgi:GT2 family glycosyltransferase
LSTFPDATAVVVNYRQAELAARCVETLRAGFETEGIRGEIVLVDCGSGPEERTALRRIGAELVALDDNRGYSGGVNAGLARASSARLLLSNADVEFRPGALTALLQAVDDPRVGAAAPRCSWDDGGRVLLPPGYDPGFLEELAVLNGGGGGGRRWAARFARFAREAVRLWTAGGRARHLSGAVLAASRDVFDRVGRFDESYPFEYEETDWERRVRGAGLELRVVPAAGVVHKWSGSVSKDPETERRRIASRRLFRERHYGRIGRALLERAEGRIGRPPLEPAEPRLQEAAEIPARSGFWLALSPHASGIPFAGGDLSRPFRLPVELRGRGSRGPWTWTIFSADDGKPVDSFRAELA